MWKAMVVMRRALAPVLLLVGVVLVGAVVLATATPVRAAPAAETGRYYVVGPPVDGQREYLYAIALRTLGNGNRFREIVQLNEGRAQPDGETFTDGLTLRPGWLLVLPRDARGQGVRIGPLPAYAPRSTRPTPAAVASSPTRPSPPPSRAPTTAAPSSTAPTTAAAPAAAPSRPASTPPVEPTQAVARPPARPDRAGDPIDPLLIRGGAGLLAVLFAVAAVVLLRRGGHRRGGLALEDNGPWPPQRHHTPTPAELGAAPAPPSAAVPAPPSAPPSVPPVPASVPPPVPPPAPPSTAPPAEPASSTPAPPEPAAPRAQPPEPAPPTAPPLVSAPTAPPPVPTPTPPANPAPPAVPGSPDPAEPSPVSPVPPRLPSVPAPVSPGAAEPSVASRQPDRPAVPSPPGTTEGLSSVAPGPVPAPVPPPVPPGNPPVAAASGREIPRPVVPAEGEVPYLSVDLETEAGPIHVRLVGVAAGRGAPAYAWLGEGEPAPPATLPLLLGRKGPWRLHVDLGRAPDVLTLVGAGEDCRRTAALFARQLRAAGVGVAVLGDALGAERVEGQRSLSTLPEPPAPGQQLPEPSIVITAGLPDGTAAGARGLAAATGGRCVPVVIGPVPGGRWSVQLGAGAGPGAGAGD
ncbi:hypothetical protein [Micromonospora fluostatini]|uniref:hypothetical protein n=1 Tax=Micromonospora sp. JCM 30529 TaxID=3421643 RepID=UPI003D16BFCE